MSKPIGAPWTASESGAAINGVMRAKTDAGNAYTYEVVIARTVTPFFNHRSAKERQDAAQLMAASPELFDAAKAAMQCIGELPPTQARVEVAQMLQAAIAKATGDSA